MNVCDIWFARIEIANCIKLKLLESFDIIEIWDMKREDFTFLGLKESTIKQILNKEYRDNLEEYRTYLEKQGISLINYKSKEYPRKLKHIPDLPAYIFVKGNINILDDDSVAIVGSRKSTQIGRKIAFTTAKELGDKNINTISGLAIRYRHLCTYW